MRGASCSINCLYKMVWVPFVAIPYIVLVNLVVYACNERSFPWRKLLSGRRFHLLAISNRAPGVSRGQRPSCFWAWDLIAPSGCVASPLVPPWVLLALRVSALLYFTALFLVQHFAEYDLGPNWLTFFTNWSFVAFAFSMILGAAHSATQLQCYRQRRLRTKQLGNQSARPDPESNLAANAETDMQQQGPYSVHMPARAAVTGHSDTGSGNTADVCVTVPREGSSSDGNSASWSLLAKVHLLSVEVAYPAELFLTVFYWAALAEYSSSPLGSTLMVHGINNVFMLADVVLSGIPFVSYHFQLLLLYGTVYLVFVWIYFGASGVWVYSILDWSRSRNFFVYLVLPGMLAIAFWLYLGLAWLRDLCYRRRRRRRVAANDPADGAPPAVREVQVVPMTGVAEEP
ncbi:hypothetical protein D9Q98_009552 [Chlorella vulgaris]|uniref:Uncharacterized protein n=1 Tax=Chlorella vulgaris TaxID=3077 RepID=A0A9D4YSY3_CHLVU|nr:hypothetical protein D9Q98_009552 [Chlorella vulgaris]